MNLSTILAIIDAVPPWAVGIGFVFFMLSVAVTLPFAVTKTSLQDFVAGLVKKK